ncbi:MAG: DUF4912 domain-containing protein [Planctomycetota bacterium]|nr:DUF4912 domain-containing protein [Planctomycetota bacterium]
MAEDAESINRLVALVRDPSTFFIYWEVAPSSLPAAEKWLLRLTNLATGATSEIAIQLDTGNWYVSALPGHVYEIELGWRNAQGEYRRFLAAGQRRLPPSTYSQLYDRQWLILEEDFITLLRLCWFGFGGSSELLPARPAPVATVVAPHETEPQPSSPGVPQYTGRR